MSRLEPTVIDPTKKTALDVQINTKLAATTVTQNALKATLITKDGQVGQKGWTDKTSGFEQTLRPADPKNAVPISWVDVYDGPQGRGWILRSVAVVDGVTFEKAIDAGPEGRSEDWKEKPPAEVLADTTTTPK